ncbi:MAG TPA: rhomboid family intramembrane serine protease [Terriglobales bacterium]|nr:rhomboid family intramembrane serine protease [Terriglobales bacterium]
MGSKPYPRATIGVLVVTGVLTSLQFVYPEIVPLLERTSTAIKEREWWRFITPLFVHPEGWRQIAFNFSSILVLGTLVERLFGACRWLGIYFACGVIGELAGYAWKPVGAGASVAGAGLLGAIAAWLLLENRSPQARIGGVIVLVSGTILTVFRDLHGPPMIVGALMGWGMLKKAEDGVR